MPLYLIFNSSLLGSRRWPRNICALFDALLWVGVFGCYLAGQAFYFHDITNFEIDGAKHPLEYPPSHDSLEKSFPLGVYIAFFFVFLKFCVIPVLACIVATILMCTALFWLSVLLWVFWRAFKMTMSPNPLVVAIAPMAGTVD
jgi:hypothetical protein